MLRARRFMMQPRAKPHSNNTTMQCLTNSLIKYMKMQAALERGPHRALSFFSSKANNFITKCTQRDLWVTLWLYFAVLWSLLCARLWNPLEVKSCEVQSQTWRRVEPVTGGLTWSDVCAAGREANQSTGHTTRCSFLCFAVAATQSATS